MPSGIDAALGQLRVSAPEQVKVNYNGFDGMKKEKPKALRCDLYGLGHADCGGQKRAPVVKVDGTRMGFSIASNV